MTRLLERLTTDIRKASALPRGWNYGCGVGATGEAREGAQLVAVLLVAIGVDDAAVFPATDGGLMVTGYRDDESFEILALPSGGYDVLHEVGDEEIEANIVSGLVDLVVYLGAKGWQISNTSVSFHQNIMTFGSGDISAWHSRIHPEAAVCRFSKWDAPSLHREVFADTSGDSTHAVSLAHRPPSGASPHQKLSRELRSSSPRQLLATCVIAT